MPTPGWKLGDRITHRELRLGDVVSLDYADGLGFDKAKVIRIRDNFVTFARPWMPASADGYLHLGVEVFDVEHDSDKTVILIGREPVPLPPLPR